MTNAMYDSQTWSNGQPVRDNPKPPQKPTDDPETTCKWLMGEPGVYPAGAEEKQIVIEPDLDNKTLVEQPLRPGAVMGVYGEPPEEMDSEETGPEGETSLLERRILKCERPGELDSKDVLEDLHFYCDRMAACLTSYSPGAETDCDRGVRLDYLGAVERVLDRLSRLVRQERLALAAGRGMSAEDLDAVEG